jgi:hypothetical protein
MVLRHRRISLPQGGAKAKYAALRTSPPDCLYPSGPIAQRLEQGTHNPKTAFLPTSPHLFSGIQNIGNQVVCDLSEISHLFPIYPIFRQTVYNGSIQ